MTLEESQLLQTINNDLTEEEWERYRELIEKRRSEISLATIDAIKKPEMTKKTSTPTNPPGANCGMAW